MAQEAMPTLGSLNPNGDPRTEQVDTTEETAYKVGKALLEAARSASKTFTESFPSDLRFATGEGQWPTPANFRAFYAERWKARTVRNYTFATIDQKMASILGAVPSIAAEARDELSTYEELQDAASAVQHEAERLHASVYGEIAFFDGAVGGKGITHVYAERDPFTGMYQAELERVDPTRYHPDPKALLQDKCRFIGYVPEMDMSRARRVFPDTWQLIKPRDRVIGKMPESRYHRTDAELIYGNSTGEYGLASDGTLTERCADIALIYVKDPDVIEDLRSILEKPPAAGFHCTHCNADMERGSALVPSPEYMKKPLCPYCYGTELQKTTLPASYALEAERRRKYPYGRLIALTDDALLYDGDNWLKIPRVYPFAEYDHYRISSRYWGMGEVAHLKEAQKALNKNIAQAIDYMRRAGNGPMEIPSEVPAWKHLGNIPGDKVPCPSAFMGLARYVSPTPGYNAQMHEIVDRQLKEDFREMSAVNEVTQGLAPRAASSGKEVEARLAAAATRPGKHALHYSQYFSTLLDIVYGVMNTTYREPRAFSKRSAMGEVETIVLEVAALPADISIKCVVSIDRQQKEELFGQNLMQAVSAKNVPFYPDIMLPMMGGDRQLSKEIARRMKSDGWIPGVGYATGLPPDMAPPGGLPPGMPPGGAQGALPAGPAGQQQPDAETVQ